MSFISLHWLRIPEHIQSGAGPAPPEVRALSYLKRLFTAHELNRTGVNSALK